MGRDRMEKVGRAGGLTGSPGGCCFMPPPKPGEDQVPLSRVDPPHGNQCSALLTPWLLPLFLPGTPVWPRCPHLAGLHLLGRPGLPSYSRCQILGRQSRRELRLSRGRGRG